MVPVYILGSIIIVLILVFGYSSVNRLREQGQKLSSYTLTAELHSDMKRIRSEYGTVEKKTYTLPSEITEVCFSEPNNFPLACGEPCAVISNVNLASAYIKDNKDKNVFFFAGNALRGVENIPGLSLGCCQYSCVRSRNNQIALTLEGKGNSVMVRQT